MIFFIAGLGFLALFLLVKNLKAVPLPTKGPTIPKATSNVPYADLVLMSSRTWGVPSALIRAIIRTESNFDPNAINSQAAKTSTRSDDSYGLMQVGLMVGQDFGLVKDYQNPTQAELGRLLNPQTNINAGTRQLSSLLSFYDFDTAIQMYNVGVAGYNKGYRAGAYLTKVKGFYNEYQV
jgi:soluble lytic murein transglycosylase-like protein